MCWQNIDFPLTSHNNQQVNWHVGTTDNIVNTRHHIWSTVKMKRRNVSIGEDVVRLLDMALFWMIITKRQWLGKLNKNSEAMPDLFLVTALPFIYWALRKYYGADIYWLKYFHLIFAWNIFGGSKSGVCWIFGWKYLKSGWSPPWWAGLNCSPRIVLTVSTPVIGDCYHCYLIHCPPDIKLALYINNHYTSRHG